MNKCPLLSPIAFHLPPFRLLGQLDETEMAFDDFWERHRTKLEQCLHLRHFEQHFREVSEESSSHLQSKSRKMTCLSILVLLRCAPNSM